jgi:predicted enzyme related to lactoylglutathione lyase
MDSPQAAGVVFVDDVLGVSAFYRAVTGMGALHAGDGYAVLGSDGFQLTVHALPVPGGDGSGTYPTRHDTYIKLCFPVPSLAQARATAAAFGGELWPAEKEWEARGFRACDGRDPEGNVFQLRERAESKAGG